MLILNPFLRGPSKHVKLNQHFDQNTLEVGLFGSAETNDDR